MEPNTFLILICTMLVGTVLFGAGLVTVLATPVLKMDATYYIPVAAIFALTFAPPVAGLVAQRMRITHWGRKAWQHGDFISG